MENKIILDEFFARTKEHQMNKSLHSNPTKFNADEVKNYINTLCGMPYTIFLEYLKDFCSPELITSENITQSSSYKFYTTELCKAFERAGDCGLSLTQIGFYLHNDGKTRKENTLNRFGLDQTKTARQFGLVRYAQNNKWYLSCVGKVFLELSESKQKALLSRCILRDPFYALIIRDAMNSEVIVRDYMSELESITTINRRLSSVNHILNLIEEQIKIECPKIVLTLNRK